MQKPPTKILIVGGGASGVLTAVQLLRQRTSSGLDVDFTITIVEKRLNLAQGLAYSTSCPHHLLNVPAYDMSALVDDRDHFFHWLTRKNHLLSKTTFAPRSLYARYLRDLLTETTNSIDGPPPVCVFQDTALDIALEKKELNCLGSQSLDYDILVLATGNYPPKLITAVPEELLQSNRYINDPWVKNALTSIPADARVFIIGTGLTMVDIAVQLDWLGHKGPITAVSRHGFLPETHSIEHLLGTLSQARKKSLNAMPDDLPANLTDLFRAVRTAAKRAEMKEQGAWRVAIDSLRPYIQSLWKGFDNADRKRFLRHLRPLWDVIRHRMAPEIGAMIESMKAQGRLTTMAGRIQSFSCVNELPSIQVLPRDGHEAVTLEADFVVNCSGPNLDFRNQEKYWPPALLADLIKHGQIVPDPLGLGLSTTDNGRVIDRSQAVSRSIFTIGSLRKGALWESVAMPEIRQQASDLARTILSELADLKDQNDTSFEPRTATHSS